MGTYFKVKLKDKSEANIKSINSDLEKLGYETPTFNNVKYGAFTTREQLKEDARFMNEDKEGLKQSPHLKRPITPDFLEQFIWNNIGYCQLKLSGGENGTVKLALVVANWINDNKNKIDFKNSDYYQRGFVKSYL